MTEQTVIKLNKEKFAPLLEALEKKTLHTPRNYSELVGWCLWFIYCMAYVEIPEMENKTFVDLVLEKTNLSLEEAIIRAIRSYNVFLKEGLEKGTEAILSRK